MSGWVYAKLVIFQLLLRINYHSSPLQFQISSYWISSDSSEIRLGSGEIRLTSLRFRVLGQIVSGSVSFDGFT